MCFRGLWLARAACRSGAFRWEGRSQGRSSSGRSAMAGWVWSSSNGRPDLIGRHWPARSREWPSKGLFPWDSPGGLSRACVREVAGQGRSRSGPLGLRSQGRCPGTARDFPGWLRKEPCSGGPPGSPSSVPARVIAAGESVGFAARVPIRKGGARGVRRASWYRVARPQYRVALGSSKALRCKARYQGFSKVPGPSGDRQRLPGLARGWAPGIRVPRFAVARRSSTRRVALIAR